MVSDNNSALFCFRCYHTWNKRIKTRPTKNCPKCKSPYWNKPRKRVSKGIVLNMQKMIINIHDTIIRLSGGEMGVRDEGGIYNSTYKLINHQYRNKNNPLSIGSFCLNEFARRHYFIDGNKRTSYAIAKIFMLINNCHLKIQYKGAVKFILSVAEYDSKITFKDITEWFGDKCENIDPKDLENYLNRTALHLMLGEQDE